MMTTEFPLSMVPLLQVALLLLLVLVTLVRSAVAKVVWRFRPWLHAEFVDKENDKDKDAAIAALEEELDKERSASASGASEAMAMICRLQQEKAQLEFEARQCRLSAEQSKLHYRQIIASLLNSLEEEKAKDLCLLRSSSSSSWLSSSSTSSLHVRSSFESRSRSRSLSSCDLPAAFAGSFHGADEQRTTPLRNSSCAIDLGFLSG